MFAATFPILRRVSLGVLLFGWSSHAMPAGALAIDPSPGGAYGWAVGQKDSRLAAEAALDRCGIGCQIVLKFDTGCGAFATDQLVGSTASGWGAAPSESAAQSRAMSECMLRGGHSCLVRVWGCN